MTTIDYEQIAMNIAIDAGVKEFLPYPAGTWPTMARCVPQIGRVEALMPEDDYTLAIFAHECGHIATTLNVWRQGHFSEPMVEEQTATRWAINAVLQHTGLDEPTPEMCRAWIEGLESYRRGGAAKLKRKRIAQFA